MAVKGLYLMDVGTTKSNLGRWYYGGDWNKMIKGQMFAALIDTDDGYILVDTGYAPNDERVFAPPPIGQEAGAKWAKSEDWAVTSLHDIRDCLKERGLTVDDIRYVIVSHFHLDHDGGMQFFKKSTVIVHKDEYAYAQYPDKFFANCPYFRDWWDLDALKLKYELVSGDKLIVPGVMVMHTPGHTPGHLSVIIDCPRDGTVILAGDIFHCWDNWVNRVPMGDMMLNTPDLPAWLRSWDRIKAYADMHNARVLPAHDSDYLAAIPWEYH